MNIASIKHLAQWLITIERDGDNNYRSIYIFGAHIEVTLWDDAT